jgi:4-diphosphocytidyl-2-C-methyl-D-erythritol kinase
MIIHPGIDVNTSEAYQKLDEVRAEQAKISATHSERGMVPLLSIVQKSIHDWKNFLINDFEEIIFPMHSLLSEIKQLLYDNGAVYASMSGSGSSLFGIFAEVPKEIFFPSSYKIFQGKLG